jgi:hypothetical protein
MRIGEALDLLYDGKKVARNNWNGKRIWLKLQIPDAFSKMTLPYIYVEYPIGHPAYPKGCRETARRPGSAGGRAGRLGRRAEGAPRHGSRLTDAGESQGK